MMLPASVLLAACSAAESASRPPSDADSIVVVLRSGPIPLSAATTSHALRLIGAATPAGWRGLALLERHPSHDDSDGVATDGSLRHGV